MSNFKSRLDRLTRETFPHGENVTYVVIKPEYGQPIEHEGRTVTLRVDPEFRTWPDDGLGDEQKQLITRNSFVTIFAGARMSMPDGPTLGDIVPFELGKPVKDIPLDDDASFRECFDEGSDYFLADYAIVDDFGNEIDV